jgi:hypothetical protein
MFESDRSFSTGVTLKLSETSQWKASLEPARAIEPSLVYEIYSPMVRASN